MSPKATILRKAEFNPKIKTYILWYGVLLCTFSVVLIPLIPLWLLFASIYLNRYFERLECELTTRSLRFKKGYIFQTERTIPLDKIQDLTFKEGPLLKYFGLSVLKIETAGNTGQGTSDLSLIGIIDASEFRSMVFEQRDKVTDNTASTSSSENTDPGIEILKDIRDTLARIEVKLSSNTDQ
ncbi:PH domain-containing protein [Gracilimonas tropica]|uniref:PH domain-containing protein n=1 Tax=Gracilimonas tropica TaxID=454600 RepID=UPI000369FF39|nr:PH domain-containing protein [Gracilimonas tropica]